MSKPVTCWVWSRYAVNLTAMFSKTAWSPVTLTKTKILQSGMQVHASIMLYGLAVLYMLHYFILDYKTSCTYANNLHIKRVKYLINKNYSTLVLMRIKNYTLQYLMPGYIFWRSTDQKQGVNRNQSFVVCESKKYNIKKFTVLPQAEAKGSKWNMLASLGLCLRQICCPFFWEGIKKNKGDFHHCWIISFLKMSVLKKSVW